MNDNAEAAAATTTTTTHTRTAVNRPVARMMPPVKTHAMPACCRTNLWSPGSSGCTTSPGSCARTCLHCRVVVIVLLLVLLVVMNMMVMIMMVVATPCLFLLLAALLTHANRQTDRQWRASATRPCTSCCIVLHRRRTFDRLGASSSRLSLSLSSSSSSWCLAAGAPSAFFRFLPPPCCQWYTERTVRKHGPQPTMRASCCIMLHRRRTFDFLGA